MTHSHIDGTHFTLLDWNDLDSLTRALTQEVEQLGQSFDRIIAVANGGLTMARHFGDRLGMKKISLLQTAFYADINQQSEVPQVLQPLVVDVEGEDLLVFEDIVDSGTTIEFIRPLLLNEYGAKSVTIASLISKSWATTQPDCVAEQLDTWIIYPYETRESIEALSQRWMKKGVAVSEIHARLEAIGFSSTDIAVYIVE